MRDKSMKIMFVAMGSEIISISALSAVLKQRGHTVGLAFDRALFDDKQYFSIPFLARLFDDRRQVIRDILEFRPDLLAFSVFADNYQWCLEVARAVRPALDVPVIMGGIHPTSVPEVCIADPAVDILCVGEGDYALPELVESMARGAMDTGIAGLWFKTRDGTIIRNPARRNIENLDELPYPDKELFAPFIPISHYYLTVTNKGCVAHCSFCSQNFYFNWERDQGMGRFFRQRSVAHVIGELKLAKTRHRAQRIDIKNNVLSTSKRWTLEFLERYKQEVDLPFRIMGHPRTIDREIAQALKRAGCWHIQLGVQTLNETIRRDILERYESNADIFAAVDAMEEAGLHYSVDIMVGLPGEKNEEIEEALRYFSGKRNVIRASIFWLVYLPGVSITKYALENRFIGGRELKSINEGLHENYLSTGMVNEKEVKERLLNYQMLFRLMPMVPAGFIDWALRSRSYRIFKYLPQVPLIVVIDILVSILRKDHWALYAMYSYYWELKRRVLRRFKGRRGGSGDQPLAIPSAPVLPAGGGR
ncbi:MAG: cobalamin-dependent protein [Magnetococcales bacterium]|nr:cobalamin-dependent protein [Magnetococcales bacterium]